MSKSKEGKPGKEGVRMCVGGKNTSFVIINRQCGVLRMGRDLGKLSKKGKGERKTWGAGRDQDMAPNTSS